MIKHTAKIIADVLGKHGGDDLVMTAPDKCDAIYQAVVAVFDSTIEQFYDEGNCKIEGHIKTMSGSNHITEQCQHQHKEN